jgi:hypothetical protein
MLPSPTHLAALSALCAALSIVAPRAADACQQCASASSVSETLSDQQQTTTDDRYSLGVSLTASRRAEDYGVGSQALRFREWRLDLVTSIATERWSVFTRASWLSRQLELESNGLELAAVNKLGDFELGGGIELLPSDLLTRAYLTLQLGMSFPTGQLERNSRGEALPDEVQPGTGSFTPFVGLRGGFKPSPVGVRGGFVAYLPIEGRYDFQVGNSYQLDAVAQYEPTAWLRLHAGPAYLFNEPVFINGTREEDTGGGILFGAIGATFNLPEGVSLFATVRVPLYKHLFGTHDSSVLVDFGARWNFSFGSGESTAPDAETVTIPEGLLDRSL